MKPQDEALAASSINAHTSAGIDASDAWLAASVMIYLAPIRSPLLLCAMIARYATDPVA
jgi:hypothetical protein